jgi:hypothetical protein
MTESAVGRVGERLKVENQRGHIQHSHPETIEIIEAVILALVAVATAWSGYQAARWYGRRVALYSEANRFRVEAEMLATLAGQERIYDNEGFNAWVGATLDGKTELAQFYERRFRPEYRPAFMFKQGTDAGDTGDQYVRITVILATVLLVTAIGQRFHVKAVRTAFMIVASLLLCFPFATLFKLPRI